MTPLPTSSPAPPPPVTSSQPTRPTFGRGPTASVTPAQLAVSLTDLSYLVTRAHAIRSRGGVTRDLDERLAGVIAELESLIHDLLHGTGPAPDGATTPPSRVASTVAAGAADGCGRPVAEAALQAWLTSDDKPDVWQLDGPDQPPTSLTTILGELVLSHLPLPADAAAALGMPSGTTLGDAATELLLAVNDPAGPRCRSYRSALYYLRDHDGTPVGQ